MKKIIKNVRTKLFDNDIKINTIDSVRTPVKSNSTYKSPKTILTSLQSTSSKSIEFHNKSDILSKMNQQSTYQNSENKETSKTQQSGDFDGSIDGKSDLTQTQALTPNINTTGIVIPKKKIAKKNTQQTSDNGPIKIYDCLTNSDIKMPKKTTTLMKIHENVYTQNNLNNHGGLSQSSRKVHLKRNSNDTHSDIKSTFTNIQSNKDKQNYIQNELSRNLFSGTPTKDIKYNKDRRIDTGYDNSKRYLLEVQSIKFNKVDVPVGAEPKSSEDLLDDAIIRGKNENIKRMDLQKKQIPKSSDDYMDNIGKNQPMLSDSIRRITNQQDSPDKTSNSPKVKKVSKFRLTGGQPAEKIKGTSPSSQRDIFDHFMKAQNVNHRDDTTEVIKIEKDPPKTSLT